MSLTLTFQALPLANLISLHPHLYNPAPLDSPQLPKLMSLPPTSEPLSVPLEGLLYHFFSPLAWLILMYSSINSDVLSSRKPSLSTLLGQALPWVPQPSRLPYSGHYYLWAGLFPTGLGSPWRQGPGRLHHPSIPCTTQPGQ